MASLMVLRLVGPSFEQDFPLRPLQSAGEDLDHGRFAGAVLPDDAVDRILMDVEAHVVERQGPGELLVQTLDGHQRSGRAAVHIYLPTWLRRLIV